MIPVDGLVLNINKPIGWTSFDVVRYVRRVLDNKKVGHVGTLDPFASGVLLVCVGKATKQVTTLMEQEKEYKGTISLDCETDTLDLTGKIIGTSVTTAVEADINSALPGFVGEIMQMPPAYSALKKNGTPYYKLVRAGKKVVPEARKVKIFSIIVSSYQWPELEIVVTCSKGTYIRSLARDVGAKIGCKAYLKALQRIRIGDYKIENSVQIEELEKFLDLQRC